MPKKKKKNKVSSKKYLKYKVEGKIIKRAITCPKCGPGIFLAEHKDRQTCGFCGYTVMKGQPKQEAPKEQPKESKK